MTAVTPLVSCIMPTADRAAFARHAVACFQRQDYPRLELVIVDDGTCPIEEWLPADSRIRYVRLPRKLAVGEKRNAACEAARGELIVHWDDDDWSAPWRVSYQVDQLRRSAADLCGLNSVVFASAEREAWRYRYPPAGRPWVYGATFCYTRTFWQQTRFCDVRAGEDNRFVWSSPPPALAVLDDHRFFVGTIHSRNTSPKRRSDGRWIAISVEDVRDIMGAGWTDYAGMLGLAERSHER